MSKWDGIGLTQDVVANLEALERTFGAVEQEGKQMSWQQESDDVQFAGPIVPKKDCRVEIAAAEKGEWKVKKAEDGGAPGYEGKPFAALKLTCTITDPNVQTEYEGGRPRLTLEHQLNLEKYPYVDKKSGEVKWLGRTGLYDLEEAFGFDPVFTNGDGQSVEPFVTRNGRKVAPKGVEGVKRQLNPDFVEAYFTAEGSPNLEWAGKTLFADIGLEKDDRYGDRNRILRFKRSPVGV